MTQGAAVRSPQRRCLIALAEPNSNNIVRIRLLVAKGVDSSGESIPTRGVPIRRATPAGRARYAKQEQSVLWCSFLLGDLSAIVCVSVVLI